MRKIELNSAIVRWKAAMATAMLAGGLMLGCNEPQEQMLKPLESQVQEPATDAQLVSFLSGETGSPTSRIKFDKKLDAFVIDGDMRIDRKEAQLRMAGEKSARVDQRRASWLLSDEVCKNIVIYIDPVIEYAWKGAIREAVAEWNDIARTRLHFSITTSKSAANLLIVAKDDYEDPNVVASMGLPRYDGTIQGDMTVNVDYNSEAKLPFLKKKFAIAHELGHAVGFMHTDKPSQDHIDYQMGVTPAFDQSSVMNSVVQTWVNFSGWDQLATAMLYPLRNWVQVQGSARDIAISPGEDEYLWAVGNTPLSDQRGYSLHRFNFSNSTWTQIPGAGERIAVTPNGQPIVVKWDGSIHQRQPGGVWKQIPGEATDIAVGMNSTGAGIFIIGKIPMPGGFSVHKHRYGGWDLMPVAGAVRITVDIDGNPWVVNNQGHILRYQDGAFKRMPGLARDIAAGKDGYIYIIGRTTMPWGGYSIHRWQGNTWTQLSGAGVTIAAFNALRGPVVINNLGKVQLWQ